MKSPRALRYQWKLISHHANNGDLCTSTGTRGNHRGLNFDLARALVRFALIRRLNTVKHMPGGIPLRAWKGIMKKITLYYHQGSSDKIYQAAIEARDGGYVVNFAFGRRGTTLSTGAKTQFPVSYETAKAVYDKLVRGKTAKGYTPGADGTPYQCSDKQASGILPQLLNAIGEEELEVLLDDRQHVMQEKFDGRRLMLQKSGNTITGINKLGVVTGFPAIIADEFRVADAATSPSTARSSGRNTTRSTCWRWTGRICVAAPIRSATCT